MRCLCGVAFGSRYLRAVSRFLLAVSSVVVAGRGVFPLLVSFSPAVHTVLYHRRQIKFRIATCCLVVFFEDKTRKDHPPRHAAGHVSRDLSRLFHPCFFFFFSSDLTNVFPPCVYSPFHPLVRLLQGGGLRDRPGQPQPNHGADGPSSQRGPSQDSLRIRPDRALMGSCTPLPCRHNVPDQ